MRCHSTPGEVNLRTRVTYSLVALGMILADQWVKRWVETSLAMHEMVEVLPLLSFYRTHNTGIAFSMLAGAGGHVLIAMTVAIVAFVLWLAWRTGPSDHLARLGFALIVSGAIGNIIDRVRLGYVIDYVLLHTHGWSFAIFNLADACISVGSVLVIAGDFVSWRRERTARRRAGHGPPSSGG